MWQEEFRNDLRKGSVSCVLKLYQTCCHASNLLYSFRFLCAYFFMECSTTSSLTNLNVKRMTKVIIMFELPGTHALWLSFIVVSLIMWV